jgi:gas vesicle protein
LKFLEYSLLVKFVYKEDRMKRITSFMVGAMMGVLVGGTLALLLAPSSGPELRNQMQERAERLREEIRRAAADRRDELEAQLAALRAPKTIVE